MQQSYAISRENMIEGQLRPNRVVSESVLEAMRATPREQFVPRHLQSIAYVDEDIAVGNGRYLPEPMVLARLLQEAGVKKSDIVLDVGCGTGYSTAVLGRMGATVVAIERDKAMAGQAENLLRELDVCNAAVIYQEDLAQGHAQGPFNVILINGSVPVVPEKIKAQLADGGRLVTVLSSRGHMGSAILITRNGDTFSTRVLFDAATPTLAGFEERKSFVF